MVRNDDVERATDALSALVEQELSRCRYHGPPMIHPRIDELLNTDAGGVDSRYALVIVAAKRARQINNYHHQLGEGMGFEEASAAARRVALEELLDHVPGGDRPGQDQVRLRQALDRFPVVYETLGSRLRVRARLVVRPWPASLRLARYTQAIGHNGPMARILLGITGGIAAYKACELTRLLVKAGHDVLPLPTRGAERFVRAETFFALARKSPSDDPYPHLERADLLVIAPLTANTMAKLAHGLADDVLTEAALAHRGPVLVAPAMNTRMWEHPATQANAATLRARGVELIGPEAGELAEGEVGARPDDRAGGDRGPDRGAARRSVVPTQSPLAGARVLVSAGGTREPLDAVRFLGNRSSGRMGVALAAEARAARRRGDAARVEPRRPAPDGVEVVQVPTAADLEREATGRAPPPTSS